MYFETKSIQSILGKSDFSLLSTDDAKGRNLKKKVEPFGVWKSPSKK